MSEDPHDDAAPGMSGELPEEVRAGLVRTAAEVLGTLDAAAVPAGLRQVQRFAPRRRASAGAQPLWHALEHDDAFRGRVARVWSHARPELADALVAGAGDPPDTGALARLASAEPAEVAAGAWLLRPEGWPELARQAAARLTAPHEAPGGPPVDALLATAGRRAERAEAEAARLVVELGTARLEAARALDEAATLRREQRRLRSDADRARSEGRQALAAAQAERAEAERARAEAVAASTRADEQRRAAAAEHVAARGEVRLAQDVATVRARLLLDTLVDAGAALRHELALPPVDVRPADAVAPRAASGGSRPTSRGREVQDPALLDELLALPHAHLVVDGYNVTKSGYPQLTLTEQRRRLVDQLANVAARTGAEITCCFDGQPGSRAPAGTPGTPRTLRVLFSVGEIADDLIRRLVHAEPAGRVVVVVTSDQQVANDVQAAGAWAVPAETLLARLSRL
ncbi:NYN domain-containing protein [Cellulomonas sp. P22]|uniref:NYN domain-containing protein n=1 Tax=Cellulomonas sp. P22 TaxID=3373189 RepID=UPI00379D12E1